MCSSSAKACRSRASSSCLVGNRNVRAHRADFREHALRLCHLAPLYIGADGARALDAPRAELAPHALIAHERPVEVLWHELERAREAARIERRLGDAHADVRTGDEGAIAKEDDPAVHDTWRHEVEDRLEEGLRALDDR